MKEFAKSFVEVIAMIALSFVFLVIMDKLGADMKLVALIFIVVVAMLGLAKAGD